MEKTNCIEDAKHLNNYFTEVISVEMNRTSKMF